jgi:DNA topoisomerase-1
VDISAGEYGFKVSGKTPLFAGYTAVYNGVVDDAQAGESGEAGETAAKLPELTEGEILDFSEYSYEQKFTKPPARFTEASLVKTMEEKGIGRPATYTPTVSILFNRIYVEKEGKFIKPTVLGEEVTDMLVKYFPDIMNVEFTALMEDELDKIEDGGMLWQNVIAKFYNGFEEKVAAAQGDSFSLKEPDEETDVLCSECGANMVIKTGRFGKFYACPNYPKCRNTMQLDPETGKPVSAAQKQAAVESDVKCEKCGKTMVIKQGRYGEFLACPGYPQCKNIKNIDKGGKSGGDSAGGGGADVPLAPCPLCGKPLKKIVTRKSTFYGCTAYPDCSFTSSAPVTDGKCPDCGGFLVQKSGRSGTYTACGNKSCDYKSEQIAAPEKNTENE